MQATPDQKNTMPLAAKLMESHTCSSPAGAAWSAAWGMVQSERASAHARTHAHAHHDPKRNEELPISDLQSLPVHLYMHQPSKHVVCPNPPAPIPPTVKNAPLSSADASIPHLLVELPYSPNTTTAITPDPCASNIVHGGGIRRL